MVDLLAEGPLQVPTLTEVEEALAVVEARHHAIESLMAREGTPDVGELLAQLVNRPAWHRQANCRGADPDLFFPEPGTHRPVEALAYCEDCSVRSQCLASALEAASTEGVWGGTSGRDRKGLRRSVA
jgi:WhiB family redox-sensing transcriptional regulator